MSEMSQRLSALAARAVHTPVDRKELRGDVLDSLLCMFLHGATWDGNVPSKVGRDCLCEAGLAVHYRGWAWLTDSGHRFAVELGMVRDKERYEANERNLRRLREGTAA